jgi:hypothetical protein
MKADTNHSISIPSIFIPLALGNALKTWKNTHGNKSEITIKAWISISMMIMIEAHSIANRLEDFTSGT